MSTPLLADADYLERIEYVRSAFDKRKIEIDSSRLAEALITTFREGYTGNHQPFASQSLTLHHGRISTNGKLFPNRSDHWYPPLHIVNYSRANLPGEAVLYCSSGVGTSLLELRPTRGDLISMMTCSVSKDVLRLKWLARNDPFGLHGMEGRNGEFERLCSDIYRRVMVSPHQYMISGAYGSLFFKFGFVDGLAYSSIATDLNGVNVAIKGSVADEFVVPESFRAYRVTASTSQFEFTVQCVASAIAPDHADEICWTTISNCQGHQVDPKYIFERPGSKRCAEAW
jgi:hypothetical protein